MEAKFVVLALSVCVASASVVTAPADLTSFSYDVADPYTGDFKSQVETRAGGAVSGQYSLLDADGTRRTVDYSADDLHGFNAVVRKDAAVIAAPAVVAPAPAVVAPAPAVVAAAPAVVDARAAPFVTARTFGLPAPVAYAAAPYAYTARAAAPIAYW